MPKGVEIRPTQDKVRQAIFNIVRDMNGKRVLELFAGTGAFGIEALSRGADFVTFVDNNIRCIETIRQNLDSLDVNEIRYELIRANAMSIMPRISKEEEKYDIVFLDPPYHEGFSRKSLINIDDYDIVSDHSVVIVEHFKKDNLTIDLKNLVLETERRYGDTLVTIFRRAHEQTEDSHISGDV